MQAEITALARKIIDAYQATPEDRRLLIAIGGPPGSGKSTLAYPLADKINSLLSHPPRDPAHVDAGANTASPGTAGGDEVALCVGLDGWHYSRAELDRFPDPDEAHWLRGAPFTFDLPSYLSFIQRLHLTLLPHPPTSIPFPTFDHALKDPSPAPNPILPRHRIVLVEGLYTLLDADGWRECASLFDLRVFVDVQRDTVRERLIRRNFEAGIVDSLERCAERVDASDMVNGEQVRNHVYQPTDIVHSIDEPRRLVPVSIDGQS